MIATPPPSGQLILPGMERVEDLFQPDLLPNPRGEHRHYKLFFALVPPAEDVARIARAAAAACSRHALTGTRLAAHRLHVTLHVVDDFRDDVPRITVDAARSAAAAVACAPLRLAFDQALGFKGSGAFVLRCDPRSDAAIARLQGLLRAALRRVELRGAPVPTPHMTLAYDERRVPSHPIEPIGWTATDFVLILSHRGLTHHQRIGRWPLQGPSR